MDEQLIDRERETDSLLYEIQACQKVSVKILVAGTGTGKSSIVEKLIVKMRNQNVKLIPVIVQTKPINSTNIVQNGDFIKELFMSIRNLFISQDYKEFQISRHLWKKLCFSNYVANCKNKFRRREILETILKEEINTVNRETAKSKILFLTLNLAIKRLFKLGNFNEQIILKHLDDHYDFLNEYIIYCLTHAPFLICIDNIQNIDTISHKYLLECINYTKSHKNAFILEFTTKQDNINSVLYLQNSIERSSAISVEILPISVLEPAYAVDIALNCSNNVTDEEKFKTEAEIYYRNNGTGNIYDLKKFSIIYDEKNFKIIDDASLISLLNLKKSALFLIGILILHNGEIKKDILIRILKKFPDFIIIDISDFLDNFSKTSDLVEKNGNTLKLTHASIIDTWKNNKKNFKYIYYAVYQTCVDFYLEIQHADNYLLITKKDCIMFLLNAYAEFDPNEIISIINEIEEIAVVTLSATDTWHYLEILFKSIAKQINSFENLFYKIIQICIQAELFDQAKYCLDKMKDEDISDSWKYRLYSCTVMILREEYSNAQNMIEQSINNYNQEIKRYFSLLKIVVFRSTNQIEKLSCWLMELESNRIFDGYFSEGYFLRLAEAYDSRDNAIEKLKQSIHIFENFHDEEQIAKSRISLSYLYAITGQLDKAKLENEKAENTLLSSVRNKCIFLVNKSALKLLNNEFGKDIWCFLDEAEKLTQSTFNKTAIYINKLIWCIENKDKRKGEYCIRLLISFLQDERDKHMHAISFYNLYVYYKNIAKDSEKANMYYEQTVKNKNYCNTLKARIQGENTCNGTEFLLTKKWHVCFLSYWDIDLTHLLSN